MAKIKNTKKDIRYLTEQVITDAIFIAETLNEEEKKEVITTISNVVNLHNELIGRVNKLEAGLKPSQVKLHFNKIYDDLLIGCDNAYKSLTKFMK